MIKIGTALFEACEELESERGISKEVLIASLCDAMVAAYKKHMHVKEAANIEAILDEQTGEIGVFSTKVVVKTVEEVDFIIIPYRWMRRILFSFRCPLSQERNSRHRQRGKRRLPA
jgi:hypothetical protein